MLIAQDLYRRVEGVKLGGFVVVVAGEENPETPFFGELEVELCSLEYRGCVRLFR